MDLKLWIHDDKRNDDFINIIKFGGLAVLFLGILIYAIFAVETDDRNNNEDFENGIRYPIKKIYPTQIVISEDILCLPKSIFTLKNLLLKPNKLK